MKYLYLSVTVMLVMLFVFVYSNYSDLLAINIEVLNRTQ